MIDHPLLATLDPDERERIAARLERRTLDAGAVCVEEGTVTTEFFLILSGRAEATHQGRLLRVMETGDFFGETGALDPGPGYALARTATVTATAPTELAVMSEQDFTALLRSAPRFRELVYAQLNVRQSD